MPDGGHSVLSAWICRGELIRSFDHQECHHAPRYELGAILAQLYARRGPSLHPQPRSSTPEAVAMKLFWRRDSEFIDVRDRADC